jgi:hypothetical protein
MLARMPRLLPSPIGPRLHEIQTEWAMVRRLDDPTDAVRRDQWERLLRTYHPAMRAYAERQLRRFLGDRAPDHADDAVASFVEQAMAKAWLSRANPAEGKFRQFLQTLLKRFSTKHALKIVRAEARTEGTSVDELIGDAEPEARDQADEDFDRAWVKTSVSEALARLQAQHARYGDVIWRLLGASERGEPVTPKALGVSRDLLHKARRAFQRHFADVLRTTVFLDAQVGEEWSAIERWLP